ncbi:MAG: nitrilase-related carbon-nitrogen hydrolase [Actinomycetales bacterium]|nr:nitrilase-related carbon-nitrogen hydrolase [Leifsonia sp.]
MTEVQTVTIACCQLSPAIGDREETWRRIAAAVSTAAARGANVVVLPELANCGYIFSGPEELANAAEPADGATIRRLTELARHHNLIVVSGFAERGQDGAVYNSAALIDPTGTRAIYRKAHLWGDEAARGFTPGSDLPPAVDTSHGRIAIMVCYDLEFPEWVRLAALTGADLLCAPVNWPLFPRPAGERPGEIIRVQADAATNRLVIAAADRAGDERGQRWLGGSVIVDADGYPLTPELLDTEGMILATVDVATSRDKRIGEHNEVHADRRPELYRQLLPPAEEKIR